MRLDSNAQAIFGSSLYIPDSIIHDGDTDTKIRFASNDQISFETAGVDRGRFDNDGNFIIGTTGHGNAGAGARKLLISGASNVGLSIHTTTTSGIYRDCSIYFGQGTSVADMARGQFVYSNNGDYFHLSVGGSSYTLGKSFRLHSDGTVRFDSTPTATNSMSLIIKSHKSRVVDDNNGIVFLDGADHTQAVINVQKKSTSNATSDLVFRTSSGQVVNTLQGIPERMRLTSNGQLLINQTTSQSDELLGLFTSSTGPEMIIMRNNSGGTKDMMTFMNVNNSGSVIFRFKQTGGLGNVGSVTTSSNSTSYNTSSDYRLKENAVLISDGITRLKTLKPYRFNFKTEPNKTVDGFFAHEVTAVPESITGEKDAVETTYYRNGDTIPEGKSVGDVKEENAVLPQSLDYAKLTPLLTAALQEAITEIETLKTKVAALEGS